MEKKSEILGLLDMMTRPGFCTKDFVIVKANPAARQLMLETGMDIRELLCTGIEELDNLSDGCLCLTLQTQCGKLDTAVTGMDGYLVFLADPESSDPLFQAMALVSRELRKPLDSVMRLTDQLLEQEDPTVAEQAAQVNRGLYQLLRIVGNLSFPASASPSMELREVGALVDEIMEKSLAYLENRNLKITYTGLNRPVFSLVSATLLERALLNLLSNAVKFTPSGGQIRISLTQKGNRLQLQVHDSGSGIADQIRKDLFCRYLRQPGIEDSRHGLGLGLVLVRSCATLHGGTLLFDTPESGGSRFTLTMTIRQTASDRFLSPLNQWYDYTGGRDHLLVELSECLSTDYYNNK